MDDHDRLAERFQTHRSHLRRVAYRMLGSLSEADDAVQEAWLRLSRADTSGVENLAGCLTRVLARLRLAVGLTIKDDKIAEIDVIADPPRLHQLDLAVLND